MASPAKNDKAVMAFALLLVVCCCCSCSSSVLAFTGKGTDPAPAPAPAPPSTSATLTSIPHQIIGVIDGWCSHPTAVHQDVPGCGRICSDPVNKGSKDKGTWGPWETTTVDCPGANLDDIWKLENGVRTLKVGTYSATPSSDTCVETCAITTKSADGKYRLEMQADCNLVIYDNNNTAIWSSGTAGAGFGTPYKTIMQNDGNLVLYDKNDNALWSSQTAGYGVSPYKAMIQNDGNLVVYDKNSLALWSSMNGKNTSL